MVKSVQYSHPKLYATQGSLGYEKQPPHFEELGNFEHKKEIAQSYFSNISKQRQLN